MLEIFLNKWDIIDLARGGTLPMAYGADVEWTAGS